MKIRNFTYTKDNGDKSERTALILSQPRSNYLMYDVSKLTTKQLDILHECVKMADEYRQNAIADFELTTGIKEQSLWRSFKPEGIEWNTEDDKN